MKCQVQVGHGRNDYCDKPAHAQVKDRRGRKWWVCRECERAIKAEQAYAKKH